MHQRELISCFVTKKKSQPIAKSTICLFLVGPLSIIVLDERMATELQGYFSILERNGWL